MKTNIFFIAIFLSLFYCMSPFNNAVIAGNNTDRAGSISIFSTPEMYPLASKWAGEYSRLHPDQQISVIKVEGSALQEMVRKGEQVGFISGDEISGLDLPVWNIVVGRDVIVPVMNAANPYLEEIGQKGISAESIAASIKNTGSLTWGTLLNNDLTTPVHYYIVNDKSASSELASFLKTDLGKTGLIKVIGSKEIPDAIRQDPYAIGFCRLTDIAEVSGLGLAENIRLLPIDKNGNGKLDYMEQIYGDIQSFSRGVWIGKYPKALTRDIFSVSGKEPESETGKAFLSWVVTDGQRFLNSSGYCDLVINERQSQLDKINPGDITVIPTVETASYQKYILIGLAALLVIGFLLDRAIRRIRKHQAILRGDEMGTGGRFNERSVEVPNGLYFDKTHTWAFMEQDGIVKIGIDDFLSHVTGPVTRIVMKNPGEKISKGDPFLTIIQHGKKLVIHSPVSGTIMEQNRQLEHRCIHSSLFPILGRVGLPGGTGKLAEGDTSSFSWVIIYKLDHQMNFTGLRISLPSRSGSNNAQYAHVVLQDGGALKESLLAELGPEDWEDFQNKFLDSSK